MTVDLVELSFFHVFFCARWLQTLRYSEVSFAKGRAVGFLLSIFDHKSQPWDRKWSLTWWRTPLKGS